MADFDADIPHPAVAVVESLASQIPVAEGVATLAWCQGKGHANRCHRVTLGAGCPNVDGVEIVGPPAQGPGQTAPPVLDLIHPQAAAADRGLAPGQRIRRRAVDVYDQLAAAVAAEASPHLAEITILGAFPGHVDVSHRRLRAEQHRGRPVQYLVLPDVAGAAEIAALIYQVVDILRFRGIKTAQRRNATTRIAAIGLTQCASVLGRRLGNRRVGFGRGQRDCVQRDQRGRVMGYGRGPDHGNGAGATRQVRHF